MKSLALLGILPALALAQSVTVTIRPNEPVALESPRARFEVSPRGYLQGSLLANGKLLTLDEPGGVVSGSARVDGVEVAHFPTDYTRIETSEVRGSLGRGRRVVIPAQATRPGGGVIERRLTLELYEEFPQLLIVSATYRNAGAGPFRLERVVTQQHRLSTALTDTRAQPWAMWSFHGAAPKWGLDDVVELTPQFARPNVMGTINADGFGGGTPLVAFWTRAAGTAIGHLETLPLELSVPVYVGADGRPRASIEIEANATLQPGESFSTPPTFQMVYSGDYYEPLRMYSLALQRQGWKLPKPTNEDYAVSWCGWGYQFNVTAGQMLGIIPKLKEYGIHWATLDDRWFENYGDWQPRPDTFPGRSIQDMVAEYHRQGIKVQIWWLPIGAEVAGQQYVSHKYVDSQVVKQHPDWLILDKNGKPALMVRGLAAMCPALKAVQEYHRRLTRRFIEEWGFDGHKLDNIYTVPECYNPKHRHASPADSLNAMGEVYRAIFETTRRLKPDSVTQSCPCGTPPNIAWARYMDQAVTADPIGAVQVRRRVKMYKALLGPESAVYGDHVELTVMPGQAGRDFASSIGTGAVVGTKFVWPETDAKFKNAVLTPDKDAHWKKWIALYNEKMLSRGEFLNLYTIGYDVPEGYAIRKGNRMYYAFFSDHYKGEIELRGLPPGRYHVLDYANHRDYGLAGTRLPVDFAGSLLLEVVR